MITEAIEALHVQIGEGERSENRLALPVLKLFSPTS
jgi:hypothetical protein